MFTTSLFTRPFCVTGDHISKHKTNNARALALVCRYLASLLLLLYTWAMKLVGASASHAISTFVCETDSNGTCQARLGQGQDCQHSLHVSLRQSRAKLFSRTYSIMASDGLLCKHADLSLNSQCPHISSTIQCYISTGGKRLVEPWDLMTSQSSGEHEF